MVPTDVNEFFDELGAGVFKSKLAAAISEAAEGVVRQGDKTKKGGFSIDFVVEPLADQGMSTMSQIKITQKLKYKVPTKNGFRHEEDVTTSAFFVGKGGRVTAVPQKEDSTGQMQLVDDKDAALSRDK